MNRFRITFFILIFLFPFVTNAAVAPAVVTCAKPLKTQGKINVFLASFFDPLMNLNQYVPSDLMLISDVYTENGKPFCLRKNTYVAFLQMNEAIKKETGYSLIIRSAFRSYTTQITYKDQKGDLAALPGRSEHQLGTTIDIIGTSPVQYFIDSEEYKWMKRNAYKFGFVETHQQDPDDEIIIGEPWHWRYVGIEIANEVKESDMSLSEYLHELINKKS
jgi:zinc D-Ala-D-Ala carboxypeptidase